MKANLVVAAIIGAAIAFPAFAMAASGTDGPLNVQVPGTTIHFSHFHDKSFCTHLVGNVKGKVCTSDATYTVIPNRKQRSAAMGKIGNKADIRRVSDCRWADGKLSCNLKQVIKILK